MALAGLRDDILTERTIKIKTQDHASRLLIEQTISTTWALYLVPLGVQDFANYEVFRRHIGHGCLVLDPPLLG